MNEEYSRKIRERSTKMEAEKKQDSIVTPEVREQALAQGGQQMTQAAAQGSATGTIGGGLMAAGAIPSPASPYLMAAGLGMQVLAAGEQNKRDEEEAQRQAYNERIKQRQAAMAQIAGMGIQ